MSLLVWCLGGIHIENRVDDRTMLAHTHNNIEKETTELLKVKDQSSKIKAQSVLAYLNGGHYLFSIVLNLHLFSPPPASQNAH